MEFLPTSFVDRIDSIKSKQFSNFAVIFFLRKLTIFQWFSNEEIANECECSKDDAIQ